jgi:DNA-binding PadR family transcriptional regulator
MDNKSDNLTNLSLTETTYFILLSLAPGPRHGYSVMKDVRQLSDGRIILSTGTLYSALKRLLDQGWIERTGDPQGSTDGRGRKAYRLTPLGQQILQAEVLRLQGLVKAARQRVLGISI